MTICVAWCWSCWANFDHQRTTWDQQHEDWRSADPPLRAAQEERWKCWPGINVAKVVDQDRASRCRLRGSVIRVPKVQIQAGSWHPSGKSPKTFSYRPLLELATVNPSGLVPRQRACWELRPLTRPSLGKVAVPVRRLPDEEIASCATWRREMRRPPVAVLCPWPSMSGAKGKVQDITWQLIPDPHPRSKGPANVEC